MILTNEIFGITQPASAPTPGRSNKDIPFFAVLAEIESLNFFLLRNA
jgi:hypothetical protein